MTTTTAQDRVEFYSDLLITAIENGGYGQFWTREYDPFEDSPYAVIEFTDAEGTLHRVTPATMAHGLGVITSAERRVDENHPDDGPVLHNAATGQRLYMGSHQRERIVFAADPDNDEYEAGDLDVIDALAILECALLGAVTYA